MFVRIKQEWMWLNGSIIIVSRRSIGQRFIRFRLREIAPKFDLRHFVDQCHDEKFVRWVLERLLWILRRWLSTIDFSDWWQQSDSAKFSTEIWTKWIHLDDGRRLYVFSKTKHSVTVETVACSQLENRNRFSPLFFNFTLDWHSKWSKVFRRNKTIIIIESFSILVQSNRKASRKWEIFKLKQHLRFR